MHCCICEDCIGLYWFYVDSNTQMYNGCHFESGKYAVYNIKMNNTMDMHLDGTCNVHYLQQYLQEGANIICLMCGVD